MKYFLARYNQRSEDKMERSYTTRALRTIANNLATAFGGMSIQKDFDDIIKPLPVDERTEAEVKNSIMQRLRGIGD